MSEKVSEKEVQDMLIELKNRRRRNECPTEFSGKSLDAFMKSYKKGDVVISTPVWDNVFDRETIALTIERNGVSITSEQKGKPIGD